MNILKFIFRFILSYNFMKKYSRKVLMFVTNIFFYKKKRLKSFGDFSLYLDLKEYTAWSYFFKKQEKEEEIFLRKVIKGTDNILDIGANLGFYSLLFVLCLLLFFFFILIFVFLLVCLLFFLGGGPCS